MAALYGHAAGDAAGAQQNGVGGAGAGDYFVGQFDAVRFDGPGADHGVLGRKGVAEASADGFEDTSALLDDFRSDAITGGVEDVELSHILAKAF